MAESRIRLISGYISINSLRLLVSPGSALFLLDQESHCFDTVLHDDHHICPLAEGIVAGSSVEDSTFGLHEVVSMSNGMYICC